MKPIARQIIYMGPHIRHIGLGYANVFRLAADEHLHPAIGDAIRECPSIGELFVPVQQTAAVRKELNFDYSHNMRGTTGKYVTFYREVQKWLAFSREPQPTPSGVTIEPLHHA